MAVMLPRPSALPARSNEPGSEHEGMGLGFFIAKTLLERSRAKVEIANRDDGTPGALVKVVWPREAIEADSAFPSPA